MLFATISQPLVFVWMMLCGCAMALWYALADGVRRLMGAGFWLSLLCDLVFALGCAVLLMGGLIMADYGRIRLYSILGAVLGATVTGIGLIGPVKCVFARIYAFLQEILTKLAKFRAIKVLFK